MAKLWISAALERGTSRQALPNRIVAGAAAGARVAVNEHVCEEILIIRASSLTLMKMSTYAHVITRQRQRSSFREQTAPNSEQPSPQRHKHKRKRQEQKNLALPFRSLSAPFYSLQFISDYRKSSRRPKNSLFIFLKVINKDENSQLKLTRF